MSRSFWGLIGGAPGQPPIPEVEPDPVPDEPDRRMPLVTPSGRIALVSRRAARGPLVWQEPLDATTFGRYGDWHEPGAPVVLNIHGWMGPWGNDLFRLDLAAEMQPREMDGFLLALLHMVAPDIVSKRDGGHLHTPFGAMVYVDGRWRHRG